MVASYFLTGFVYVWFPNTAPDYKWLVIARCTIALTFSAPIMAPFINDYVVKKYRGRAIALNGVGVIFGELFAMGVLLKLTSGMNYYDAFFAAGCVIWGFCAYFAISIKDPDLEKLRRTNNSTMASSTDFEEQSVCAKMVTLSRQVKRQL
jgi:MFS family permease